MILCCLSIYNGFVIMNKQIDTIEEIKDKQESEVKAILNGLK